MAAYLMYSLLTGIACAVISLVGFDAGLLGVSLWYVAGSWVGFAASVTLYMLRGAGHDTPVSQWPEGSTVR